MTASLFLRAIELIGEFHNLETLLHVSLVEKVLMHCVFSEPKSSLITVTDGMDQVVATIPSI